MREAQSAIFTLDRASSEMALTRSNCVCAAEIGSIDVARRGV
jgi:hypothetical protein